MANRRQTDGKKRGEGRKGRAEGELRDGTIDAGLHLLAAITPRGHVRTQAEIAQACGCSTGYIFNLEKNAKKKLREAFERRGIVWTGE